MAAARAGPLPSTTAESSTLERPGRRPRPRRARSRRRASSRPGAGARRPPSPTRRRRSSPAGRRPPVGATEGTATTVTDGSASRRDTARCSVGRPRTTTCSGRRSSRVPSSAAGSAQVPAGSARPPAGSDHSGDVGSASTGTPSGSARPGGHDRPAVAGDDERPGAGAQRQGREGGGGRRRDDPRSTGAPSGRPSSAGSALVRGSAAPCGSSSGSRSGTSSWTGPGSPPLVPAARSSARATTARQERAAPGRSSASGITTEARTASPNIPTWSMVWLAPLPTSSTGRSALTTSRPTPLRDASSTAGWRLATAVPEVTTTGTIRPEHRPEPHREEARAALVDADVQAEPAVAVGGVEGDEQRRVARPGARDGVGHPRPDPLVDDDVGLRRRGNHPTHGNDAEAVAPDGQG